MECPSKQQKVDEGDHGGHQGQNLQVLSGAHGFTVNSLAITTAGKDLHIHHVNENVHTGTGRGPTIEGQRETILKYLKAPDFHGIYASALEQRMARTGSWFLELPDFQTFMGSKGVTLWCTGMPGAGKTILASIAIERLYEVTNESPNASLAFAFLRYSERYKWKEVLTSLLAQLVKRSDLACTIFWPYYSHAAGMAASEPSITVPVLEEALCALAGKLERLYVVSDGLDEATDEVKDRLLELLVPSGANLLILSRPLDLYKRHAPGALSVSVQAETNDIELYVRGEVERSSRLKSIFEGKPDKISELCRKVTKQSDGMFLVAKLQMEAVKRSSRSPASLFRNLAALPAGVNAMYDHTLARIRDSEDASIAFRTLAWIKYAYSDDEESLRPACLQHALSFNEETQAFDTDDVTPVPLILSACQGLVTVEERLGHHSLRFIHYTTSEYLELVALDGLPNPHLLLAQTCLVCMEDHREWVLGLSAWGSPYGERPTRDWLSEKPLLWYSHLHWAEHVSSSQPPDSVFSFVYPYISKHEEYPSIASGPYRMALGNLEVVSGTHLIAIHNLIGGFEVESAKSLRPNLKSKPGGFTPFHFAAMNGRFDTFCLLLPSCAGVNLASTNGDTVLHVATRKDQTSFVQQLHELVSVLRERNALPEGFNFDVNSQANFGSTPFMISCENGNETLVRLFSSCEGVNINIQDINGRTALHHLTWGTCRERRDTLFKMLCSLPQVDVDICDFQGNSVFVSACKGGLEEAVRYLLAKHGNGSSVVHQVNESGETALMSLCSVIGEEEASEAIYPGFMAILEILLAHGSSLHAQDVEGRNPFLHVFGYVDSDNWQEARSESWQRIVDTRRPMLMGYFLALDPALIDQCDTEGRTALIFAVLKDDVSAIRWIFSHRGGSGDFVNAQDNRGMTALLHGCRRGARKVVAALLESPCVDIYHQCRRGLSGLDWVFSPRYDGAFIDCFEALINAREWDPSVVRKAFLRSLTRESIFEHLGQDRGILGDYYGRDFLRLSSLVRGYFTWDLDDNDTILLLVKSASVHPCRVHVALVLCSLGLLPAEAPFGTEWDGVNCGCFKDWEKYWPVYQGINPFDGY